ncbi:MAG: DUF692 domain-containing protein [Acidithiobacillus sp.]
MINHAIGLGLRREFLPQLLATPEHGIDFFELAPENWIGFGGLPAAQLRDLTQKYPFIGHGLSLSIGGPAELDWEFLGLVRDFMAEHDIQYYSEHLAYCADHGQLYDLLPLPFTTEMVQHVSERVRRVQDFLQRPLILENTAYYGEYRHSTLSEQEFLLAILEQSDCRLLLDLNNLYVNSVNHHYDAHAFLRALPTERIVYQHLAGHARHPDGWLIDTHDSAVAAPVWDLLRLSRSLFGPLPTLLEWDNQIPPLPQLLATVQQIREESSVRGAA